MMNFNQQAMNTLKGLLQSNNPKDIVMQNFGNSKNPMISNLMNIYKGGNQNAIETFARNVCQERGIDFEKEFTNFIKQLKG